MTKLSDKKIQQIYYCGYGLYVFWILILFIFMSSFFFPRVDVRETKKGVVCNICAYKDHILLKLSVINTKLSIRYKRKWKSLLLFYKLDEIIVSHRWAYRLIFIEFRIFYRTVILALNFLLIMWIKYCSKHKCLY